MSKIKFLFVATIWASGWNHIQVIEKRRLDQKTRSLMVNDTLPEGYETKMVRTLESGEEQVICISNYFPSQEAAQQFIDDKIKSGKFGNKSPDEKVTLKMKLFSHAEYLEAWKLLNKFGYRTDIEPFSCQYLYGHANGRLGVDFFDVEGADLNSPNSAEGYFQKCAYEQVTLELLREWAKVKQS